jgi:imidazolonepropionase-like amidohydrolase
VTRLLPFLVALLATPALAQTVAVTGATVIPVRGDAIEGGTVLIRDGRIEAVGAKDAVKIPFDAMQIEAEGKVVFPGMVLAHSVAGLDRANESLPVTPFLDVYDAINPASVVYQELLREGVTSVHVIQANATTIGGVGRVLQPLGLTAEAMTILSPSGLKISVAARDGWDRVRQRAQLREAFAELEDYLDGLAEERFAAEQKKQGKEDEKVAPAKARAAGRELLRPEDVDDAHRNLYLLTRGQLDAYVHCQQASDVPYAVAMATELGFLERTTFVLDAETWKAAAILKETGRPVVLPAGQTWREEDPATGEEEERFLPAVFAEAGVPFALSVSSRSSFAQRYLWYQAARCVAHGVSRQTALEAITIAAAEAIGVADQVGSLEAGKQGNLLVLSGDPLDATTHVEQVLIRGRVVYERSKDFQLRKLLEGELSGATAAEDDEHPHPIEEDEGDPEAEDGDE